MHTSIHEHNVSKEKGRVAIHALWRTLQDVATNDLIMVPLSSHKRSNGSTETP